jgi:hypothetical protein
VTAIVKRRILGCVLGVGAAATLVTFLVAISGTGDTTLAALLLFWVRVAGGMIFVGALVVAVVIGLLLALGPE